MAAISTPRVLTFKADGSISKGKAVKMGTDKEHVAIGAANTDKVIGLAYCVSTAAEDLIEVAIQGGGGKALLGETVVAGNDLVSHTDGSLVKANAAGDQIICRALEGGDSGSLIAVEVYYSTAHAAD